MWSPEVWGIFMCNSSIIWSHTFGEMDIRGSDNGGNLYVILRYVPNMVMCLFSAPWRCFLSAEFSVILQRILKNVLICWPRWKSAFRSSRWPDVVDASVEKFVEDNKIVKIHLKKKKLQTLIQSNLKLITWFININKKKKIRKNLCSLQILSSTNLTGLQKGWKSIKCAGL